MVSIRTKAILVEQNGWHGTADPAELDFQERKSTIHEELVDSLNLSAITELDPKQFADQVRQLAEEMCSQRRRKLQDSIRPRMVNELMNEVFGLGPLEPLMNDPTVNDILVNHAHEVYVERNGRMELTNVIFANDQHVLRIIQRLTARVGRRIDEVTPMVDARLPDGSRVNAIIPPLALSGPTLSIRRFRADPFKMEDLVENGTLTGDMADFLASAVEARLSMIVSGGAGAGKTTLLNALTSAIPGDERVITIEDSAELKLQSKHVVRLETRPSNTEGTGEITQRELVRNALRMRPDRILVGEVRGAEALDMLQAMNTGHEGSLTTIHANDTRDALSRLEMMVAMSGFDLPVPVVRQYIASGVRLIVHVARLKGGLRKVIRVSEILGIAGGQQQVFDIFGYEQTGINERGIAEGYFYSTGYRPECLVRLKSAGFHLSDSIFVEKRNGSSGLTTSTQSVA